MESRNLKLRKGDNIMAKKGKVKKTLVDQILDKAKIDGGNKEWKINYQTPDGAVSAEFTTEWKSEGETLIATDKMRKSDGNSDFTITVRIFKYKTAKQPLITITMSDGNPAHEMVFANQKDFFEPSDENGEGTQTTE